MPGPLLDLLRHHAGRWLTMAALQSALGRSPAQVWQSLESLRSMGHIIDNQPALGFRLGESVNQLTSDLIACGFQTQRVGRQIVVYDETDSTNDVAAIYAREPDYDGLAIFAESQRQGRGRLGRIWAAHKGSSILCSILLRQKDRQAGGWLSLLAGVAVAEAIKETCDCLPRIKWPNDVLLDQRKVAGTMIETHTTSAGQAYIIGIGINCRQRREDFPPDLRDRAISLAQATGGPVDRLRVAQAVLRCLDLRLAAVADGGVEPLLGAWRHFAQDIGARLTVMQDGQRFTGRVLDVSANQGLILQLDAGAIRHFDSATTSVVPA